MMFKVGDRVVGNEHGYSHRKGKTGVVSKFVGENVYVDWGDGECYVCVGGINLYEPPMVGKTLTELDVKPGDVVRCVDGVFVADGDFTCTEIVQYGTCKGEHTMKSESYGHGIFGDTDGKWIIVSRETQPTAEPIAPQRMHPDGVAEAMMQYAYDCGYQTEMIKIRSDSGSYIYDI